MGFQVIDANGRIKISQVVSGPTGPTGPTGPIGATGAIIFPMDGADGDTIALPGSQGPAGNTGPQGIQGIGFTILPEDGRDGEPGLFIIAPQTPTPSVYSYVYRASAQSIPDSAITAISFSNAGVDNSVFWSAGSPTRLTVPTGLDGTYVILGQVDWAIFGATGTVSVAIYKNTNQIAEVEVNVTGTTPSIQVSVQENLVATDFIELKVFAVSSAGPYSTTGGARSTFLQLVRASAVTGSGGGSGGSSNFSAATVSTSETQASNTTYGDLATVGPTVTLTLVGTTAIIWISAQATHGFGGNSAMIAPEVSGASTVAASNTNAALISSYNAGFDLDMSRVLVLTGLTPGSNTFKLKYQNNGGGTWTFFNRSMAVYAP